MDGKGWKPEYGISAEGIESSVPEALSPHPPPLPKEGPRVVPNAIAAICRREGYCRCTTTSTKRLAPNEPARRRSDRRLIRSQALPTRLLA